MRLNLPGVGTGVGVGVGVGVGLAACKSQSIIYYCQSARAEGRCDVQGEATLRAKWWKTIKMRQNVIKAAGAAAGVKTCVKVEQGAQDTEQRPTSRITAAKCKRVTYSTLPLMWHVQRFTDFAAHSRPGLNSTRVSTRLNSPRLDSSLDSIPGWAAILDIPACVNCDAVLQAAVNWPFGEREEKGTPLSRSLSATLVRATPPALHSNNIWLVFCANTWDWVRHSVCTVGFAPGTDNIN